MFVPSMCDDCLTTGLSSRPSGVRIPSTGYLDYPLEGEAGRWCLVCTPGCFPASYRLFSTRPTQIRPYHLLLESTQLTRAGCPRRGWFTCHGMRAHVLFLAMGTHPASAWSAGSWPSLTQDLSCLLLFPSSVQVLPVVVLPSYAMLVLCRWDRQRTADQLRHVPVPADPAQGRGKGRRQNNAQPMHQGGTAGRGERHSADGSCQGAGHSWGLLSL